MRNLFMLGADPNQPRDPLANGLGAYQQGLLQQVAPNIPPPPAGILPVAPEKPQGFLAALLSDPRKMAALQGLSQGLLQAGQWRQGPRVTGAEVLGQAFGGMQKGIESYEEKMAKEAAARLNAAIEQRNQQLAERKVGADEKQAEAALIRATQERDPEALRLLDAMGIDPQSPQGLEILRSRLTGEGKGVNITIGNQGQGGVADRGKFAEALAGAQVKRLEAWTEEAGKAEEVASNLQEMDAMLADPFFETGWSGIVKGAAGKAAQFVGLPTEGTPYDAARVERFNQIQKNLSLMMKPTGMGAMSDGDRKALESIQANMYNSKEANRRAIEAAMKMQERKIMRAQMAEDWISERGSLDGFNAYWNDYMKKNPLFAAPQRSPSGNYRR